MTSNIIAFSSKGEYFAYSSPDGCLKIWETSTGVLKQEYTPSSHLSATCSSLCWGPNTQNEHVSKKSKKSRNDTASSTDLQFIAMGTMTGDILLYSFTNAELHSCLSSGHSGPVTGVSWIAASNSLLSCSKDMHIIIWNVCTGKIKFKWKADTVPIHSVCAIDEYSILSSGSTIKWWDIQEKIVIKSFSGHSTDVTRLLPVLVEDKPSYFLSVADSDRVINAWHLSDNNSKKAVASFVLPDQPECIDILSKKDEAFTMSVVSRDGAFYLFKHLINGKNKKALHPVLNIKIASKGSQSSPKPHFIPIIAACISEGLDSCLLTYGQFMNPKFERMDITDVSKDLFLIRDMSFLSAVSIEDSISKIKHTDKSSNIKMLAPGHMTDVSLLDSKSKKRKQKDVDIKELPMEERLKALDLSKTPKNIDEEINIKSDSMVHLLLQGLQSKDNNMLNTVLQCGDELVIQNTLERLPLQSILIVLKELYVRLNKQEPRNHPGLRWLNGLLAVHLPYLMSCMDIDEYLGPISQLMEARAENFSKMLQLRGCLKILLSQASSSTSKPQDISQEPLIEYESESSEESENEEGNLSNDSEDQVIDNDLHEESLSSNSSDSDMDS